MDDLSQSTITMPTALQGMYHGWAMEVHAPNSSTREVEVGGALEIETSLVYTVSSRTARATERPCLKKKSIP